MIINTPIQKLEFKNDKGINIYCKRDDLLPFSLGGNKVRIGEAFFQDMIKKNCNCMVVYGNSRSNLCRVLANLCSARKVPVYMICSVEEHENNSAVTNNSRLMDWLGAKVIPCNKDNIADTVENTMENLLSAGFKPYYIYGNKFGTGNEGTAVQAYVDGYKEIYDWEHLYNVYFSHIFFASGTGCTQSGLISGKLLNMGNEQIIGICISSREYNRAVNVIKTGITEYYKNNSLKLPDRIEDEIILETAYRKGGYGLFDAEIINVIREEFCLNGIPFDPTYTGKAFWGMKRYLEEKDLSNCNVLFLHTGGTPLFYDNLLGAVQ